MFFLSLLKNKEIFNEHLRFHEGNVFMEAFIDVRIPFYYESWTECTQPFLSSIFPF